jgi:hypothetical protein
MVPGRMPRPKREKVTGDWGKLIIFIVCHLLLGTLDGEDEMGGTHKSSGHFYDEGERRLGRSRHKWKYSIKRNVNKWGWRV